jgi:integrase
MSPFLSQGGKTYKGRVRDRQGRRYIRSLGTRSRTEARLVEAWLTDRRDRGDWRTIDAVIAGRVAALDAYRRANDGTLAEHLDAMDTKANEDSEPDLAVLVAEWAWVARSPKYVRQVRGMIPEGARYPRGRFTRGAISAHLASLHCAEPTKNRHRVALSQFARWLVEREYLTANPVRDVRGFRERDPRMVHYTREERRRVADRSLPMYRVTEAFMWGAGLEFQAVRALRRRDVVGQNEVHARGQKSRWRTRVVRVTDPDAWAIIAPYLSQHLPDSPLFPGLSERRLLEAHVHACELAGVERSTLHDWRHTYAIQALRDGLPPQTVKRQLGHSPHSTMLERVYGAWLPRGDADYLATNLATSATFKVSAQGAK